MKELRKLNPKKWSYPQLGYKFGVSALSASKIVTSNFAPTPEQRVMRWLEREEFKSIQTTFLKSVAKEERAKLTEEWHRLREFRDQYREENNTCNGNYGCM